MMCDTTFPRNLDINNLIMKLFVRFKVTFKMHKSSMAANQVGTFFLTTNARILCNETFLRYLDARNLSLESFCGFKIRLNVINGFKSIDPK